MPHQIQLIAAFSHRQSCMNIMMFQNPDDAS